MRKKIKKYPSQITFTLEIKSPADYLIVEREMINIDKKHANLMSVEVDWEWLRDIILLLLGVLLGGFLAYLYGISLTRRTLQNEAKYRTYEKMIPICKELSKRFLIISTISENNPLKDNINLVDFKTQIHTVLLSINRRDLLNETDTIFEEYSRQAIAADTRDKATLKLVMDKVFFEVEIEIQYLMDQLEQNETILLLSQPSKRVRESLKTFRSKINIGQVLYKVKRNLPDKFKGYPSLYYAALYYGLSITSIILSDYKNIERHLKNLLEAMQDDLEDTLSGWQWWTQVKRRKRKGNQGDQ